MISKFKKLVLALIMTFVCVFSVEAATSVKEDDSTYQGATYIIGSTRFTAGTVLKLNTVKEAISNEWMLQLSQGIKPADIEIVTYYRSGFNGAWYEISDEAPNGLRALDEEEEKELTDNLHIYYVDNEEKQLTFEYSGSINPETLPEGVTYVDGNLVVPATTKEVSFETEDGTQVVVEPKQIEEEGELEVTVSPKITITIPESDTPNYINNSVEAEIKIKGNSYADETKEYYLYYYLSNTEDLGKQVYGSTTILKEEDILKFNLNASEAGTYTFTVLLVSDNSETLAKVADTITFVKKAPLVVMDLPETFKVGEPTYFTVSTVANDYAGVKVVGVGNSVNAEGNTGIEKIEFCVAENSCMNMNQDPDGKFGVAEGFELSDAESMFRVTFNETGTYTFTFGIESVEGEEEVSVTETANYEVVYDETNTELVAKVGNVYYKDLLTAIEASTPENAAVLLHDTNLTQIELTAENEKDYVLDLNGKTLSFANDKKNGLIYSANNGSLTINNGLITCDGSASCISVKRTDAKTEAETHPVLNLNSDIYSKATAIKAIHNVEVNVTGKIEVEEWVNAVSGLGNPTDKGTIFNITGAEIIARAGTGIYLPNIGTANIIDSKITALLPIGIKSGILNVRGGSLIALGGANASYHENLSTYNNGITEPGDAIYVEVYTPPYGGEIVINVTNTDITSVWGKDIRVFNATGEGAVINAEGYEVVTELPTAKVINGKSVGYFTSVEDAKGAKGELVYLVHNEDEFKAAIADTTSHKMEIMDSFSVSDRNVIEHELTINGNGHTISAKDENSFISFRANATIDNLNIVDHYEDAQSFIYVQNGGTLNALENVEINTNGFGIVVIGKDSNATTLNFSGTINTTSTEYAAISGNGYDVYGSTTININEGAVINAANNIALYIPQNGIVNIADGVTITANTVIGMKSGILNVAGGLLTATGEYVELPELYNNGQELSGDVITVEINKSYFGGKNNDNIQVNITGGTLVSNNGNILRTVREEGNNTTIKVSGKYAAEEVLTAETSRYVGLLMSVAKADVDRKITATAEIVTPSISDFAAESNIDLYATLQSSEPMTGVRFELEVTSAPENGVAKVFATDTIGVYNMIETGWGPAEGFDVPALYKATTPLIIRATVAGEYTATLKLVKASDRSVVASKEVSVVVE